MLYRFITDDDTSEFCHRVSDALSKGWSLYGSPAYGFDAETGVMRCGQAVTKTDAAPYEPGMKLGEQ